MVSPVLQRVRTLAPVVASSAVVTTLVTCVILAKARDVYTGGLKWPYFSDMGRDSPGYYVFCVGLTITAIALVCTWNFNLQFQRAILEKPIAVGQLGKSVLVFAKIHACLGMISVIGLPVLVRSPSILPIG
jgi:DNA damage-regulated autophagy modulator protein 2